MSSSLTTTPQFPNDTTAVIKPSGMWVSRAAAPCKQTGMLRFRCRRESDLAQQPSEGPSHAPAFSEEPGKRPIFNADSHD